MKLKDRLVSYSKKRGFSFQTFFFESLKTIMAVLIAYLIAIIIILIVSDKPSESIYWFVVGPFSNMMEFGELIKKAIPLMFAGIAACVIVKANQFNLFTEGAFYVGGLVAALIAIYIKLPAVLAVIAALVGGGLVAAIFGYIPAKLKSSLNVNEFVSSIMLNFIVLWIGVYLISNVVIDDASGDTATQIIPEVSKLKILFSGTNISYGLLIVVGIVILVKIFFSKTLPGYEIKMTGDNENFAKYSGINVQRRVVMAQTLGIFIAGVGGATEILSNYHRFNWKTLPGYGFDGFMVTIIAKNKPLFVPLAALFIGYLRAGADLMAFNSDVAQEVVAIIQGVIILLIASERFFSSSFFKRLLDNYKERRDAQRMDVMKNE
ncbi:MAG: ABC transporter permease [Tenericutes bacterium HGW-Tenericutes-5]|nr:MAG: ABC transporter permease [Tenericutes bacterium HGW-Tenericutes-5]